MEEREEEEEEEEEARVGKTVARLRMTRRREEKKEKKLREGDGWEEEGEDGLLRDEGEKKRFWLSAVFFGLNTLPFA